MKKLSSLNLIGVGLGLGVATIPLVIGAVSANSPLYVGNNSVNSRMTLVAQNTEASEEFTVVGNEPFWNVIVNQSGIFYETPETKKERLSSYIPPQKADGRPLDVVRVYRWEGKRNGILIINKVTACSDTMSDTNYPYMATLILGNTVRTGCALRK